MRPFNRSKCSHENTDDPLNEKGGLRYTAPIPVLVDPMASSLCLLETMNLLDHADQARARPCADPDQLLAHLRTLSAQMATPLTDAEAVQAVATYLDQEPPTLLDSNRPATPEAWQAKLAELNGKIEARQRRIKRLDRWTTGSFVTSLSLLLLSFVLDKLGVSQPILPPTLGSLIVLNMLVFMKSVFQLHADLVAGHEPTETSAKLQAAKEVPSPEQQATWRRMPGGAEALAQIEASGVPFLVQDVRQLKNAWWDHRHTQEAKLHHAWRLARRTLLNKDLLP